MAVASRAAGKAPQSPESYESLARRNAAAQILQSYEKLSWYGFQRCETRMHFQNIVAGFTDGDEARLIDWKEDFSPRSPKPGAADPELKGSRKGKERESLVGGDGAAGSSPRVKSREKSHKSSSESAKKKQRGGSSDKQG